MHQKMEIDIFNPFRIINIGNSTKVKLSDFIKSIETKLKVNIKEFLANTKGRCFSNLG